jgi:hypothetical protein
MIGTKKEEKAGTKEENMASIEIIIRDESGQIIVGQHQQRYEMNLGQGGFAEIEGAVEGFKQAALADIEATLLGQAQARYIKKRAMSERDAAGDDQGVTRQD